MENKYLLSVSNGTDYNDYSINSEQALYLLNAATKAEQNNETGEYELTIDGETVTFHDSGVGCDFWIVYHDESGEEVCGYDANFGYTKANKDFEELNEEELSAQTINHRDRYSKQLKVVKDLEQQLEEEFDYELQEQLENETLKLMKMC